MRRGRGMVVRSRVQVKRRVKEVLRSNRFSSDFSFLR